MELLLLAMFCAMVVVVLVPNEIWNALFVIGGVLLFGWLAWFLFIMWIVSL